MLEYLLQIALTLLTYGQPKMTADQYVELKDAYEHQDEDRLQIVIEDVLSVE